MNVTERLIDGFVDRLLAWRGRAMLLLLIAIGSAAAGLPGLYLEGNYRSLFKEGNANLVQFTTIEDRFSKSDNVMFTVTDLKDDVFSPDALSVIVELTTRAWKLPYAKRVDSLANYQHTTVNGDDLVVEDFIMSPQSVTDRELDDLRFIAASQIEIGGRLVSRDEQMAIINVTLALPYEDSQAEQYEIMDAARALQNEFASNAPDIRIDVVGMAAFNHALIDASQSDAAITMPAMFLAITILLSVFLRSLRATILTLGVAIIATLVAMGAGGWMKIGITPPTGMTPNIVLIVAVANCVHLFLSFLRAGRRGLDRKSAIRETMRKNFIPILLTNLSTAIGFLSMGFSESPPFADLGVLVAIGLAATAVLTLVAVPIALSWLPERTRRSSTPKHGSWTSFAEAVTKRPGISAMAATALAVTAGGLAFTNELNDNIVEYLSSSNTFRKAAEHADAHIGGTYSIEMAVHARTQGGATKPSFLIKIDSLANWLRAQPEVLSVNAISDTVRRLNQALHQDSPEWYRIPSDDEAASQYLLLYELSLPLGLELTDQIDLPRSAARVRVSLPSMSTNEMLAVEQRIRDWMSTNMTGTEFQISSPTLMFAHMGELNTRSSLIGALVAVFLISAILGLALKSFKLGLVSLVPNLIPAAVGFGIWAMFFGDVGMSLAMVAGMTLGIVVDDTIHLLSRYMYARRQGMDSRPAVANALNDVGHALIASTVILTVGFVMLMLSTFRLNSDMGLLTAIIILTALLFDLVILPALLVLFDRDEPGLTDMGQVRNSMPAA